MVFLDLKRNMQGIINYQINFDQLQYCLYDEHELFLIIINNKIIIIIIIPKNTKKNDNNNKY